MISTTLTLMRAQNAALAPAFALAKLSLFLNKRLATPHRRLSIKWLSDEVRFSASLFAYIRNKAGRVPFRSAGSILFTGKKTA